MNHVHKIALLAAIDTGMPSDLRHCTIKKVIHERESEGETSVFCF